MRKVRKMIENSGGYIISEGTLKTKDLIASIYQFLVDNNLAGEELLEDIRNHFVLEPNAYNIYHSLSHIKEGMEDSAEFLLNEELYDLMNDIAPDGYYFGSSEGDGACIGFFNN